MLYLYLFHGRLDPEEDMNDWGTTGPTFRTGRYAHTTYASDVKLDNPFGRFQRLLIHRDLIYYGGVYYGDWSVTADIPIGYKIDEFDPAKAELPPIKKKHSAREVVEQCILRWEVSKDGWLDGIDELTVEEQNEAYREVYELNQQIEAGQSILEEFRLEEI